MKKLFVLIFCLAFTGGAFAQAVNNYVDASGTVGASGKIALAANPSRAALIIENVSASNTLYVTIDGTSPSPGAPGTFTIAAATVLRWENKCPSGAVEVFGSGTNTAYTIKWL